MHILDLNLVVLQKQMDLEYYMELLDIVQQNLVVYLIFVKKDKTKGFFNACESVFGGNEWFFGTTKGIFCGLFP